MRVLITIQPSFSHAVQVVPLARALHRKGHAATVVTSPPLAQRLRAFGLDARDAGKPWMVRPGDPVFERTVGAKNFFGFTDVAQDDLVDELEAIARDVDPDIVVREYAEFAGFKLAKRLNVPLITHGIMHRLPPPIFQQVAQLAGAASAQEVIGAAFLDVVPQSLRMPWEQDAPWIHAVRPSDFDGVHTDATYEWLSGLGVHRPLVYFTMGTVFNGFHGVWRAVFDAVSTLDVDVLCTTGADMQLDGVADNVRIERYVPQSLVLARSAAIICHAGFGTMTGALRHGVPILALPVAADQPLNARSCAQAGAGINGANAPAIDARGPMVDQHTLDSRAIADALQRLLTEPQFRERARSVADEIAAMPGPEDTVEALLRHSAHQCSPAIDGQR